MRPDRALGVFETMLVRDGRVLSARRHVDRLAHSIGALYGMGLPAETHERLLAEAAPLDGEHRLRVDVVPGDPVRITTAPVAAGYRRPVTLEPFVIPGGLGAHKWRDRRLLSFVARHRGAISEYGGAPTPLLIDADGSVLEAAWGNVWLVEDDRLITPPADGRILPGVTRAVLLELAPSFGLHPREEPISLHRALTAPITFVTSAIRLAVPATVPGGAAAPAALVGRIRTALSAH